MTCTGALQANQFSVRGLECVPAVPAHAQAPAPSTLGPTKRAGTPTKRYFWLCRHTSLRQICRHIPGHVGFLRWHLRGALRFASCTSRGWSWGVGVGWCSDVRREACAWGEVSLLMLPITPARHFRGDIGNAKRQAGAL